MTVGKDEFNINVNGDSLNHDSGAVVTQIILPVVVVVYLRLDYRYWLVDVNIYSLIPANVLAEVSVISIPVLIMILEALWIIIKS